MALAATKEPRSPIVSRASLLPATTLFSFSDFMPHTNLYEIAFLLQTVIQLKQVTHLEISIFPFSISMHSDLQFDTQSLHLLQLSILITGLKAENFDIKPSVVPTGHTELQYNLPLNALIKITIRRKKSAKKNEIAINWE